MCVWFSLPFSGQSKNVLGGASDRHPRPLMEGMRSNRLSVNAVADRCFSSIAESGSSFLARFILVLILNAGSSHRS